MSPLRILVDLTKLLPHGEGGGINPALLTMLKWLGRHRAEHIIFLYAANSDNRELIEQFIRRCDSILPYSDTARDTATRHRCDLVYCPFGVTDLACPGIPTITLIVDLLHCDYPAALPEPDRIYRDEKLRASLPATDRFQVISDFTARRLQDCYGINPERVFRTYQPAHERLSQRTPADARPTLPYFFYPANFWVHKNHDMLLRAYAAYRRASAPHHWKLVLTGHADTRMAILHKMTQSLGIDQDVHFAGHVSEAALADWYRGAGALVFPSRYEGFGIPLLEAMAFDVPIVANDEASIPEITGPAALRVKADEPAVLAAALEKIANDSALRADLITKGRARLRDFSTDREFGEFWTNIVATAARPARWRQSGFHAVDGLVEPLALFALPLMGEELTLRLETRPLGIARTLQIACGPDSVGEYRIAADCPVNVQLIFTPAARTLILRIPDASRLSPTDPRTHGVLLQTLVVKTRDGRTQDLLAPTPQKSAAEPVLSASDAEPEYLWHIETPLPAELLDGCLEIRGWCIRKRGQSATLRLRVAGIDWLVPANLPRPDVAAIHPVPPGNACGFAVRLRVPPGEHELCIESNDTFDANTTLVRQPLEVPLFAPLQRTLGRNTPKLIAFQLMAAPYHAPRPIKAEHFPAVIAGAKRPRLSIVTPSYQHGRFLEKTMHSILGQKAAGEYFVQDGGSTDASLHVLARVAQNPPAVGSMRFLGWESSPDKGQTDAILKGMARTSGEPEDLMAWINSDDFYLPGTLAFVTDYFARHPELDVLYGNRILVDEDSREIGRWFLPRHDATVLELNDFVPQETLFWRRRAWQAVGGLDPSLQFAMDWDLLLRFQAVNAHIVHVPYFLACFRIHSAQKTSATIHSVGRDEIERLRRRTFGRAISVQELTTHPHLIRYLRRCAGVEMLSWVGARVH